jgi:hypothetical protein
MAPQSRKSPSKLDRPAMLGSIGQVINYNSGHCHCPSNLLFYYALQSPVWAPFDFVEAPQMKATKELLDKWIAAVGTMHIGHHLAASSCATWHLIIGGIATLLAAAVSAAVFTKIANNAQTGSILFWAWDVLVCSLRL